MEKETSLFTQTNKIAIMGGTFDPIHYGHLVAAEAVRKEFNIDRVIFIPTGTPPHKTNYDITSKEHRYLMSVLATASNPHFFPSRIEMDRVGPTYTIDTIKEIKSINNNVNILFIMGADEIHQISTWKESEILLSLCEFVAVTRPGYNIKSLNEHITKVIEKYNSKVHFLEIPSLTISSTDIRNRIFMEKPIKYLLPDAVSEYITKHRLYKTCTEPNNIIAIKNYLKKALSKNRYTHTTGVASEAVKLAKHYKANKEKAYIAALLHDCAKEIPNENKKKLAKEYGLNVDKVMKKQPDLLHSFLGAEIAKRTFNVTDEDILNAIKYHTTGRKHMSLLEKIINIADVIEPNRELDSHMENIRLIAYENIDKAMKESLNYKIEYTRRKNKDLHPLSLEALECFESL